MNRADRKRFDEIIDQVVKALPREVSDLFTEAHMIVEDQPSGKLLEELDLDGDFDAICGLYTGTPMTERSVDDPPSTSDCIHLFRQAILDQAGGWDVKTDADGEFFGGEKAIAREIRITILHELGHHFGLDEDDLARMGYE